MAGDRGEGDGLQPTAVLKDAGADVLPEVESRMEAQTIDLTLLSNLELLRVHAAAIDVLHTRGVVRTTNNPISDYTEWLVADKLGLTLTRNSQSGHDATDSEGARYQIKSRRITRDKPSANLGFIRNLASAQFEWLIVVIYDRDYSILHAAKIPHAAISELASFRAHVNGHVLTFRPGIMQRDEVQDIAAALQ